MSNPCYVDPPKKKYKFAPYDPEYKGPKKPLTKRQFLAYIRWLNAVLPFGQINWSVVYPRIVEARRAAGFDDSFDVSRKP